MSLSSIFCFFRKSTTDFDFLELLSWADLDVAASVTMERLTIATSAMETTLPSPLKETVLVVAAVFIFWLVSARRNNEAMIKNAITVQTRGLYFCIM